MPKCANCGKGHPASYRGCEVAKKLQEIRNETMRRKGRNINQTDQNMQRQNVQKSRITNVVEDRCFSQVLQGSCVDEKVKDEYNNANSILQTLLEKI